MFRSFRQPGSTSQRPAPAPATRRPRFRPRLEPLEDRCVPAVFWVTNTDDNGNDSLRDAITRANASPNGSDPIDTIRFAGAGAAGTITLGSALPALTGPTVIDGPGANVLTVTRSTTVSPFRIFEVNPGVSATISGLTISNGRDTQGGGILNGGGLTIDRCIIAENVADYGGGIYNSGTLTLTNSTLSGNVASVTGGGINNGFGTLVVRNSTISNNSAGPAGGGIYHGSGTATLVHTTVTGNRSGGGGGLSVLPSFGAVTLTNTL